jgi:hypothetical protein
MGLIDRFRAAIRSDARPTENPPQREPAAHLEISYSQLDITESFGNEVELGPDDWIATTPLNTSVQDPTAVGLPPVDAIRSHYADRVKDPKQWLRLARPCSEHCRTSARP